MSRSTEAEEAATENPLGSAKQAAASNKIPRYTDYPYCEQREPKKLGNRNHPVFCVRIAPPEQHNEVSYAIKVHTKKEITESRITHRVKNIARNNARFVRFLSFRISVRRENRSTSNRP